MRSIVEQPTEPVDPRMVMVLAITVFCLLEFWPVEISGTYRVSVGNNTGLVRQRTPEICLELVSFDGAAYGQTRRLAAGFSTLKWWRSAISAAATAANSNPSTRSNKPP